jgi:hypothetical protein
MGSAFGGGGGGYGGTAPDAFNRNGRNISTQPDEGGGTGVTPGGDGSTTPGGGTTPTPTPTPIPARNISAGGGFLGRTPFGTEVDNFGPNPSQMRAYNPFYSGSEANSLVDMAYRNILRRAPDPSGRSYYGDQMMQGMTGQGLAGALSSSPEFQRQQEFTRAHTEMFRPNYQETGPSGQYFQPIYQQRYTDYSRAPGFYSPSYGAFGGYNPFAYYEEGGAVEDQDNWLNDK